MDISIISEPEVTEYEKIRKYVVAQLSKAGPRPMRLASSRDLAKRFNVSRPTVNRALKDLLDDGYLSVKKGIGMFTNPGKFYNPQGAKLIGFLSGDGKAAFITRLHWEFGVFASVLQSHDERYLLQNCFLVSPLDKPDDILKEMQALGLDGLIWILPAPEILPAIQRLKASGMPMIAISINEWTPGISNFHYDFAANNQHAAELMFDEGRRTPALVLPTKCNDRRFLDEAAYGFKKAFEIRKIPFNESSIIRLECEDVDSFASAIGRLKPDALLFNMNVMPFWKTIKERLEIVNGCRLYVGHTHIHKNMDYTGYVGVEDFTGYAELAAENLEAQLTSPEKAPVLDCPMQLKIQMKKG